MSLDPDLEVPRGVPAVRRRVVKVRDHRASECLDHLAVEEPLEIRLGGINLSVTMRTPGEDEELVAGFLFCEGVITGADDLDVIARYRGPDGDPDDGNVMNVLLKGDVRVAKDRLRRNFVASSSCGLCGKATIDAIRATLPPIQSDFVISVDRLNRLAAAMQEAQSTFEKTGGLHAAGLFGADGQLRVLREDIGRHNAVDKVIGHMVLARSVPLDRHVLMVSGRVSFEIMQKTLAARIPVIAAVSAPSSMAVQMALTADMTLIGFVRNGGFNLYSGAHRVTPSVTELV
ncbi:MAG: formate dehydrogenase accessory sulfurtransferase FdhD [Candidatus Rokuibacteriota bacterium]|nr:MAG: formate dehydrogenase accessory sulfurtransferase FdhD [Candidatus Rokubacteria bacterium]